MDKEILKNIPTTPGVYIYRNNKKKIIYVGKAINLKNRVNSYFANFNNLNIKTKALVEKIEHIETIRVDNEVEALLLEATLIKKHRPVYNIDLKDDKFYKYIAIEKKNGIYSVTTTRKPSNLTSNGKKNSNKKVTFFGPFPESNSVNIILKTLRRVFPYRDCSDTKFTRFKNLKRPCLYGDLKLCSAPCQNHDNVIKNNDNVRKISQYLKKDRKELFDNIKREMEKASKETNYEKAAYLRDQIQSYEYLTQNITNTSEYTKNPNLIDDVSTKGLMELIDSLSNLSTVFKQLKYKADFRIEVYDVSNISGKNAVASMVVLTNGQIDKKEYKRFKILTKNTPNDFDMMKEVLSRRFKSRENQWLSPDLIVVDGGKGQLSVAIEALKLNKIKIPVIGLAKRLEEIVYKEGNINNSLILGKDSDALHILQKGRDEAHRFAISYYRKLHRKNLYN